MKRIVALNTHRELPLSLASASEMMSVFPRPSKQKIAQKMVEELLMPPPKQYQCTLGQNFDTHNEHTHPDHHVPMRR
jgi:hypothetical protein